jgi:hypothetical protein
MPCSGMLRRVALVRTDISEESTASIITLIRIGELGTTLAITSNRSTLADSCHTDDGRVTFFRNVGSYQSHTA